MRIDDYKVTANGAPSVTGPADTAAVQLSGSKPERTTGVAGGGDSVELSGLSRVLQASDSQRTERIESLSVQVRAGNYSIDGQTVARALILETLAGHASEIHA